MRRTILSLLIIVMFLQMTGCISKPLKTEKLRDITYTILEEHEIPKEFLERIETEKKNAFRMTYEDAGSLYIAESYGAQPKTGYRIEVAELYETEDAVYFRSCLLGPEKNEEVEEKITFPYIVVKMPALGKEVLFH